MIICICNNLTEQELTELVEKHNAKSVEDLQKYVDVCDQCTGCTFIVERIIAGERLFE